MRPCRLNQYDDTVLGNLHLNVSIDAADTNGRMLRKAHEMEMHNMDEERCAGKCLRGGGQVTGQISANDGPAGLAGTSVRIPLLNSSRSIQLTVKQNQ